ncbi:MAG: anti-sigma factor [Chloroflexi bacterium]|nr:anti-sigma factor [Chloroflexota bacterium]
MIDHDMHQQLEAYALGALDEADLVEFEAHLADCETCQVVLAEYQVLLAKIPVTLAEKADIEVPAYIKANLLTAIVQSNTASNSRPFTPDRVYSRWIRLGFAAALILLMGAVFWIFRLQTALAEEQELNDQLTHETELIFEVVDADEKTRLFLSPQTDKTRPGEAPPYGKVFVRPDMPYVVAMGGRLPEPAEGEVYSLWLVKDGETVKAGELAVNEMGFASLIYEADQNGLSFDRALVIEQEPEATTPDGDLLLGYSSGS